VCWGSGVRNRVDKRLAYLFLCQVARIRCNEVGLGGSRRHRVHAGRLFSRTLNAPLLKGKVLVGSSVRRFIRKFVWLELSDHKFVVLVLKFFLQEFRFLKVIFLVQLFILCFSAERHAINWVLGRFLMENVAVTIVPVRVASLVHCDLLGGSFIELRFPLDRRYFDTFFALIVLLGYRLEVHMVRVDNLRFFFQVKSVFVGLCKRRLLNVLLVVGRVHVRGVGIFDKAIRAPCVFACSVTNIQLLKNSTVHLLFLRGVLNRVIINLGG